MQLIVLHPSDIVVNLDAISRAERIAKDNEVVLRVWFGTIVHDFNGQQAEVLWRALYKNSHNREF